jgi:hypothetical protein
VVSAIWFPIAYVLGRRYESARDDKVPVKVPVAPPAATPS